MQRICREPPPVGLGQRALQAARLQVAKYPRRPRRDNLPWITSVVAAALALIFLGVFCWTLRTDAMQLVTLPQAPSRPVPTDPSAAGAYAQAARQSPEMLYSLLDWQWRQSAKSPLSTHPNIKPETIRASFP